MKFSILAFGSVREIIDGNQSLECEVNGPDITVHELAKTIFKTYPKLQPLQDSLLFCVNFEYVTSHSDMVISSDDEIALIAPIRWTSFTMHFVMLFLMFVLFFAAAVVSVFDHKNPGFLLY